MAKMFDVAVIGSSLSGAVAAFQLARRGISVVVIDKAVFPRRKACGEGLSARGVRALLSMGIIDESFFANAVGLTGYEIVDDLGNSSVLRHGNTDAALFGVRRVELDSILARALGSQKNCVQVVDSARAISRAGAVFTIHCLGADFDAMRVVVADGTNSPMALALGIEAQSQATRRCGFSTEWRGGFSQLSPQVKIFLTKSGQIFTTPTSSTTLNVSILGPKEAIEGWRNAAREGGTQIRHILSACNFTGELVDRGLGASPLQGRRRPAFGKGVFFVGDACETFDPAGGMGMTHAVLSSELAALAVLDCLSGKREAAMGRWYERSRNRVATPLRLFSGAVTSTLTSRWGRSLLQNRVALRIAGAASRRIHGEGVGIVL